MFVWVLKVDAHDDSPYTAGVYDDPNQARAGFESILSMWWKENRESQDYNGRNYEECVKDMVFNDDEDYLEVERFFVRNGLCLRHPFLDGCYAYLGET